MQLFRVHQFQRLFVTFARHCFFRSARGPTGSSAVDYYVLISMPMLRAVPATTRKAASSFVAFKSFILSFTISRTCFRVTLPTFSLFGSLEPTVIPAAFFSRTEAGGDLVIKVNDLS